MILPITAVLAAILAPIGFGLSLNVSMRRVFLGKAQGASNSAVFGDHGDERLRNASRAFGNFMEYTPLCLVMLALLELQGGPAGLIWGLGVAFITGRVLHLWWMFADPFKPMPRALGMLGTYAALLVPASWLLLNA